MGVSLYNRDSGTVHAVRRQTVSTVLPIEWVKAIDSQTTAYMSRSQVICAIVGDWVRMQEETKKVKMQNGGIGMHIITASDLSDVSRTEGSEPEQKKPEADSA